MRFLALAADYDGTLATNGQVDEETLATLKRLQKSGRKLLLASGRQLDDLCRVFRKLTYILLIPVFCQQAHQAVVNQH